MKKYIVIITAVMVAALIFSGCGKTASKAAGDMETDTAAAKSFKYYSIEQFMNTVDVKDAAVNHDGSRILFTSKKTGIFNVYSVPVDGGEAKQLTASEKESFYIRTAFPDDERFLFSADTGGNEVTHIFLRDTDGTIKDLTPEPGARAEYSRWSGDYKSFFYSSNKRDPKAMDLYEMDIETFTPKLIYQNDEKYTDVVISPDKRFIALTKKINSHDSNVWLLERKTGKLTNITPHEGNVYSSVEEFDPGSVKLYFLTNKDHEFSYLSSYNLADGKTGVVKKTNWDVRYVRFSPNGTYRVIGINNDGRTIVEVFDTGKKQKLELPQLPNGNLQTVRFARDETVMSFYLTSSTSPRNLYSYNLETGKYKKLTDTLNPEIDEAHLVNARVIRYKSFDGLEIPAIFYVPVNIKKGDKAPALVWVHGGPGGQSTVSYFPLLQYLTNHGYVVLAVNNRGSSGYGKTFFKLDDLKHGEDDLMDCVESKKFLIETGFVDENKIGIIGGSYGGYMVLAALAYQPDAFAVGVDIFGVANWLRTLKSIPAWWESIRQLLYAEIGNPETDEEYLRRISPLFHADKITKPLLVLQGANDPRVLKVESDEIVEAVKKNGVPVEYVVFDDEGHGFRKKKNEIKGWQDILKFLDHYLKGKKENYIY